MKVEKLFWTPDYLSARGREIYKEVCTDLRTRGILHRADLPMIGNYAAIMDKLEELQGEVAGASFTEPTEKGSIINPKFKLLQSLTGTSLTMAHRLGITPYGRGITRREHPLKAEKKTGRLRNLTKAK